MKLVCFYLLAAIALGGTVRPASAQDPPNVAEYIDAANTYHISNFDYVDPLNHRVALDIPLVVDQSQRGNLNFTYSLRYASTTAWYAVDEGNGWFQWQPANSAVTGPSFSMDGNLRFGYDDYFLCNGGCGYQIANQANDDTGAQHFLGTLSGTQRAPCSFTAESVDGSGMKLVVGSDCTTNLWAYTFTNRQGVQFQGDMTGFGPGFNGGQIEDTNGNLLTFSCANGGAGSYGASGLCGMAGSATQMEDTVGRTWSYSYQVDVSGCPYPAVQANLWQVPGPNGQMRNFTFCYSSIGISTSFGTSNIHEYNNGELLITAVILPDGTSWQFGYDGYGELTSVQLPTGGTVSYSWAGNDAANQPWCVISSAIDCQARAVTLRTSNDGNIQSTLQYNGFTVTDPAGNDAVYAPANSNDVADDGRVNSIQYFNGPAANNSVMKTVNYGYQTLDNPYPNDMGDPNQVTYLPASTQTQWPNGQTNESAQYYDSGFAFTDDNSGTQHNTVYGLPTEVDSYDYGSSTPGPLLRKESIGYFAFYNSGYFGANLLSPQAWDAIYDGNGNELSETDSHYDDIAVVPSGVSTQHGSAPSSVRGNPSWTAYLVSPGNYVYTGQATFDTGMVQKTFDARNNAAATYSYDSSGTYPTTICNALTQCTNYGHDGNTGLLTSMTDPNNQTTSYNWDIMLRPTQISYPDQGQTTTSYSSNSATVTKAMGNGQSLSATYVYDGVGRLTQTQLTSDPEGTDSTETAYDALGRVASVTNPHQSGYSDTDGWVQYQYDALNRVTKVIKQDGSAVTTTYNNQCLDTWDEAGVHTGYCADGLGRIWGVWQANGETDYRYDALGNLIHVQQQGNDPNSANWRQRTFTYDSLSRLISATNPESGTTGYTYDNNGNVLTRTDARNITTTYSYDALNRLTDKTYSDGVSPAAHFRYDQPSNWSNSLSNTIGRLSEEYTGGNPWAASIFGYDAMGRVTLNNQCTPAVCGSSNFPVNYQYDLLGDLTYALNGGGVAISYSYDGAARPTSVTSNLVDSQHPATLAQVAAGVGYYPTGQVKAMTLGNGLTESSWFDPRGGLERRNLNSTGAIVSGWGADPSGTIEDQGYAFGTWGSTNNGDITAWYSYRQNFYRTYTYDALNRLSTISSANDPSGCTGIQWTYDAWGNLTNQNQTGGSCPVFHATFTQANNRIDPGNYGFTYDAAGSLLYDGTTTYTYDAENRILSASNAISGTTTYVYDAEGRRVRKAAGATTDYVYDFSGHVVAEYPFGGAAPSYVYLNGQLLAEYANWSTYFVYNDHLGGTRLLTGMNQSMAECDDYVPFGERLSYATCPSTSVTTHKFTGKERDGETGNDNFGARYYGSSMGRFLSPDPTRLSMFIDDPQTWNMYTYAHNNPLGYVDRNGKWPTPTHVLINQMALGAYLTPDELKIVNDVSAGQDNPFLGGQFNGVAYEHAMSAPGQSVEDAEAEYNSFVSNEVQAAQEAQIKFWESDPLSNKLSPEALRHFAKALHAVEDSTSPAHAGFQLWNWRSWSLIQRHREAERNATPQQLQTAVSAAQQLYEQTFGGYDEFDFLSLLQQQQEQVTSQIGLSSNSGCSQDENGNVTCP